MPGKRTIQQGVGQWRAEHRGEPPCPVFHVARIQQQILPDLDADVGQSGGAGVVIDGVVVRGSSGVRLVVSHAQAALAAQRPEQRPRQPVVVAPEHAAVPRPDPPPEPVGEAVHGNQCRRLGTTPQGLELTRDRRMIRLEDRADAPLALGHGEPDVARDRRAVARLDDAARPRGVAIAVDHEPRIAGEHGSHPQTTGQRQGE